MKILAILLGLLIGFPIFAKANHISSKHIKPLTIKIWSNDNGVVQEEKIHCTEQSCCFEENYYCAEENGKCICDIYRRQPVLNQKKYWMELTGFEAWKACEIPEILHKVTGLSLCDSAPTSFSGKPPPPPGWNYLPRL